MGRDTLSNTFRETFRGGKNRSGQYNLSRVGAHVPSNTLRPILFPSFHDFSIPACQTETLLRFSTIQNNSTKPAPSYFQFRDFTRSLLRYRFPKRFLARSHPVGLLRVFIRQTKRMNSRYLEQRVG